MKEPIRRGGDSGRRLRDAPSSADVSADLLLRLDEHGIVLSAEGGGGRFPFVPRDLIGRALAAALPPAAAREVIEALARLLPGGPAVAVQFALATGAASHVEIRLSRLHDTTLAVLRDIGAERQELLDLAAQRAFVRQVLDLVPNMIFAKDREGRFTIANRAVAAVYGVTPSQLVGKTDAAFNADAAEVEHFRRDDLEVMDSLRPKLIREEPVTSPDGTSRWFQTIKIPIVSPDGRADAMLGVSTDITARKEAEDRLERRGERLVRHQAALRALAVAPPADLGSSLERVLATSCETLGVARAGVWLLDADRSMMRAACVAEGGAVVTGPPASADFKPHLDYLRTLESQGVIAADDASHDLRVLGCAPVFGAPAAAPGAILDLAIRSHGTLVGVVGHELPGASRTWTIEEQDFAASIADLVALILEASKRRSLEEQLRNAQKMEAIGLLAGGIAHDFNNLLGIMVGYAELASNALDGTHPASAHLGKIHGACRRAADLVSKILTFSRGHGLPVAPLDFGRLLAEFAPLLKGTLGDDVVVSVSVPSDPMIVRADRTQLEQVLLNLATNARQAMPAGGKLTLAASVVTLESGPHVLVSVSDTGHGIDDSTMARLWEPFFTTRSSGTGLGLSVVYGIVQDQGGHVRVESRVGHGTTFHVYLPLHDGLELPGEAGVTIAGRPRGETLLVVEDESLIRDLLTESLESLGYAVLTATNGAEAVALFEDRRDDVDMVILDVVMPKLSGPDALRSMKTIKPGLKALFISGHAPESARLTDALDDAGRAFLPKPFLLDELAAKVREVLDTAE